jgi:hypothetical protein
MRGSNAASVVRMSKNNTEGIAPQLAA